MSNFIVCLCCIFSCGIWAQKNCDIRFEGIILDSHNKAPVPFAKIQIKGINKGAIADTNGRFLIVGLCPGEYEIICFHHVGCKPVKINKTLQNSKQDTIFIEYHLQELEETQIIVNVFELSSLAVVKPTELERNFGAGKSLGEMLKQIPGVSSLNTGNSISKPVIHGMHSNRIILLNHEIRQEGQQWGSEHAPEMDPFLSSELSLVKGASAIRYGSDAIAGVIIAESPSLQNIEGLKGKIQTTAFLNGRAGSFSGMLEGKIKRLGQFTYRLQGTLKQAGTIQTPRYYLKNTASQESNFSWNTAYTYRKWQIELFYSQFNTNIGIFSAAHIGNLTDLNVAFTADKPLEEGNFTYKIDRPRQHIEHELFKAKMKFLINKKNKISLLYGRQFNLRQEFDKHLSYNDSITALNLPSFNFSLTTQQADLKYEHRINEKISGEIGTSYIYQQNTYTGRFFIPNFRKNSYGIYLLEILKSGNNEFELGVRVDQSDLEVFEYVKNELMNYKHQFQHTSASMGYSRLFGHHLHIRANISNAWRTPQVNELYSRGLHHGAAAIEIGRSDLKKEIAFNSQLGFTYKSNKLTIQCDGYHTQFSGFIYLKPTLPPQLTIKGAFPVFTYQQIKARFSGVDFLIQYKLNKGWVVQVKSAIVRAYNQSAQSFLVGIPSDRIEPGIIYQKELKRNRKLSFTAMIPIVAKQNRVEAESDYVVPPKAYTLLNLVGIYKFRVKEQDLSFSLEITNVFNRNYRDYMNRFRYYSDEIGRNIGFKLFIPFNVKK